MKPIFTAAVAGLLVVAAACNDRSPVAFGEANSIIVVAEEPLWQAVADTVRSAVVADVFAARDVTTFELTYTAPTAPEWADLRKWKQVLVIGQPEDPWVRRALEEAEGPVPEPPAIVEAGEVWARSQRVTVVVLPPGGEREALLELLPELSASLQERFLAFVRSRMYVSGVDTALQDTLRRQAGFSLLLPEVYDRFLQGSVYRFYNDYQRGDLEVFRRILVTWRAGVPDGLAAEDVLDWRERVNEERYDFPQVTIREPERIRVRRIEGAGGRAIEVRGVWESPPGEFPAAGPFISRVVVCPEQNRTYFLDAWLYAPGEEQYEYLVQLTTILNTFACGDASR